MARAVNLHSEKEGKQQESTAGLTTCKSIMAKAFFGSLNDIGS